MRYIIIIIIIIITIIIIFDDIFNAFSWMKIALITQICSQGPS